MKQSIFWSLSAIIGALYAVGVIALAPISFDIVQVRVIDCLIPLSAVLGFPVVIGVTIGCFIGNFFVNLHIIDVVGGPIANLIASLLAYYLRKRLYLALPAAIAVVSLIVGSYLAVIFVMPIEISILGVTIGSIISIGILGSLVIGSIRYSGLEKQLEPHINIF